MASFFSKLFGRSAGANSHEAIGLQKFPTDSKQRSGRKEPPAPIDWSRVEYIPLPPSPPTWELDGRDEFHLEYNDPSIGPVFQAGFKNQNAKVVKQAVGLTAEQRQGRVGEVIGKAYRKLIIQRTKADQLVAAARLCAEMFEMVPGEVKDVDRRRFNRILEQMDKAGKRHTYTTVDVHGPASQPLFTVSDNTGWTVAGERKLQGDERPNPAFANVSLDESGTWLLDRSGSSVDRPEVKSVLRRFDRSGSSVGERHLYHDTYRISVAPAGSFIAIMDSDGRLHIYDPELTLVTETDLQNDPRVLDHFRTVDTNYWGDFKSQVRAVDVSLEGERFLFALADEVWCCTMSGHTQWGVVMPLNEGWERVVGRSDRFGVEREVENALRLFDLSLPVNPSEIKGKYRELAMAHHPDRNPDDPEATEKMKTFNNAFEVLTGVDPDTLGFEESDVTYFARSSPDHVVEYGGLRVEITMSGGSPQDWVYAASFAATDGCAYVATYSGKVILLSEDGQPIIVYDIGTCPTRIVDTGRHTYFLTPTRLYVIEDRTKIAAFIDIFQQGQLLVSQSGFGLLTNKKIQWFTVSGTKVGELIARDPIRTVHKIEGGIIVQTRQHQAEVRGVTL